MGLGIATNDRFSPYYKLFGYGAYGTRDGVFKSQLGSAFRISKNSDSWISGSFTDDIIEFADLTLIADSKNLNYTIQDPLIFQHFTTINRMN